MILNRLKEFIALLREAATEFGNDNGTKLAASLSYFAIFAMGPLLLVIISIASVFLQSKDITDHLFAQIANVVGGDSTKQLQNIIDNVNSQQNKKLYGIIGGVALVFSASSIFVEIQGSINYVWSIKGVAAKGWVKLVRDRLVSFGLIIGIGFLLIVSLFVNTLIDIFEGNVLGLLERKDLMLFHGINIVFLFVVVTFTFAIIFKVLPDAHLHWRDSIVGAAFTGVLFMIGKYAIGYYLSKNNLTALYGTAASLILLLSWVYYSSIILYFGAEFTKVYALRHGKGITAYSTVVFVVKNEIKELPHDRVISAETTALDQTPELKAKAKS